MPREIETDALIDNLTAAMNHALKLKAREIFYLLNIAAMATFDISNEPPHGEDPGSDRNLH
jgi:hypothetical protein